MISVFFYFTCCCCGEIVCEFKVVGGVCVVDC